MNPYAAPGAPVGSHGSGGSARLEGDVLVVTKDAAMPSVCIKCGTHDGIMRRQAKFQWTPVWARISIVLCTVGGLIAILVTTKRATLAVPLCVPCNQRWGQAVVALIVGIVALVGSVFLLTTGRDDPTLGFVGFGIAFVAFLVIMLAFVKPRMLQVDKIDDREVRLKGFHPGAGQEIANGTG
jgi:hypothetical protein